ncbi:MAG: valine--tRNA ligase, partial [Pseudomonadota bacterium]
PDPAFGSGAVKITGAHDFNDFEVARRHNIPLYSLMDEQARMSAHVPDRYLGLSREAAREKIIAEIEELGLLRQVEDKMIAQPFGDRSGVLVEPFLTEQWYMNVKPLADKSLAY